MSTIDETRKLLQDLITPDLKALEARLHALEATMDLRFKHVDDRFKHVDDRFKQLEDKIDTRFKHLEEKIDLKFEIVTNTMAANQIAMLRVLDLDRRMERLEADNAKALDRPS